MTRLHTGITLLLLFMVTSVAYGQDDAYQQWLKQQEDSFQEYVDEQDAAFLRFLAKRWKHVSVDAARQPEADPKPTFIPEADPLPPETPSRPTPIVVDTPEPPPPPTPEPTPIPDVPEKPRATLPATSSMANVAFYDVSVSLQHDTSLRQRFTGTPGKTSISAYWKTLSQSLYQPVLADLLRQRAALQLNDWAYYLLVRETAQQLLGATENETALFSWFILTKSGYAARVGYNEERIFLMLPSDQMAFFFPQLWVDDMRYFLIIHGDVPHQLGALYTYEGSYPEANRKVDFRLATMPILAARPAHRSVSFKYNKTRHTVDLQYDANLIEFLDQYPHVELAVYFKAPLSPTAHQSMVDGLSPLLEDKSEQETINILLRFVQRAFRYKVDGDQFGRERYLFAEETLHYPYSDCEDRSALFASLMRTFLNRKVIGLDYPGHVATAVQVSSDIPGDYVEYDNSRYLIADPTYFGADAGMVMPDFKGLAPKIIVAP